MYTGLKHLHSTLAYLVLLFLIFAVVRAAMGLMRGDSYDKGHAQVGKLALIFLHVQVIVGLVMYFLSPYFAALKSDAASVMKDSAMRLLAVEHISVMIIAAVLFTIARVKARKADAAPKAHKSMLIFGGLALLLALSRIPWGQWLG